MLEHDNLQQTLKESQAIRLLGSQNAPLIIGFLHDQFKQNNQITIPHLILVERLEDYLELLKQSAPHSYPRPAKQYLDDWCNKQGYLRKYHIANSDDPVYELTAETERAFRWLDELQTRQFVGTESRFLHIFDLLQDIVEQSNENLDERLHYLEAEKARIESEIGRIQTTGRVETYTDTQIREKFFQLNDTARHLLADFREVEDNFRSIAREVQQHQLQADVSKGDIVGGVLDADQNLRESDQGRSFYSFWQFLMSQQKQDELRVLLAKVLQIPAVMATDENHNLRYLKRNLIDAGSKIIESNRRLAEQLRKLLDDQNIQEARRVQDLIGEIKQMVARLNTADRTEVNRPAPNHPFVSISGLPDIAMPLERPLWSPTRAVNFAEVVVESADAAPDPDQFAALYSQFFVDEQELRERIEYLLEQRPQVTLREVLEQYPLKKGLTELLFYLSMAAKSQHSMIHKTNFEAISLESDTNSRLIQVPQITFTKAF